MECCFLPKHTKMFSQEHCVWFLNIDQIEEIKLNRWSLCFVKTMMIFFLFLNHFQNFLFLQKYVHDKIAFDRLFRKEKIPFCVEKQELVIEFQVILATLPFTAKKDICALNIIIKERIKS